MTGQANFLQSLGWAVLNSLWQLALLWVLYQTITGIFRPAKSSFKSSLASSLLMGGFGWFIYTFFSAFTGNSNPAIISPSSANPASNAELNSWLQQTLPVASVLYLVLLIFPLLHFVRNYRYVQVIRKYGLTKMKVEWRMFVSRVAAQMNIQKKVQIWVSEFVSSPVTIGFLKPVILVPLAAINHLTPQQLEAVLLHELSHIKRFDYLVNLIINFIQAVLYFNPFAKAFVKIVEREREKNCDEMVLQFQYNSHEYASALLLLEKTNHSPEYFAIGTTGKKNDLLHRVECIMGIRKKPAISFNKAAGLLCSLFFVAAFNMLIIKKESSFDREVAPFTYIVSPFRFAAQSVSDNAAENPIPVLTAASSYKTNTEYIKKVPAQKKEYPVPSISSDIASPEMMQAWYEPPTEIPELKKYQEEQIKEALQASKKVLESTQWKAMEKNLADVFTQKEKEELRSDYQKELNNFDWNKWENKLRIAYDNVDWEKVNYQLNNAINQVRLDSLQRVYNNVMVKLNDVEKELTLQQLNGIPDSDILLKDIYNRKQQTQKELNKLRGVRTKKIVHL